MRTRSTHARDAALALITRINGMLITGALALSGLLTLVAAHAFPGHTATAATAASSPSAAPAPASPAPSGPSSDDRSAPATPAQAPAAPAQAPAPAPAAPVVSGGS